MNTPQPALGFARAVLPIAASTITTGAAGLSAGDVRIPTSDGEIPGYGARPESGDSFPVVLVVHEIFGVHEHIKDICRRLAREAISRWRRNCSREWAMWRRFPIETS
jgi:carboxymethylenebutenolidase